MNKTRKRQRTFTYKKPKSRTKIITHKNFEYEIMDEYENSGIGINNISLSIANVNGLIPFYLDIPKGYDLQKINSNIRQFICHEIMNRMQEPIYNILRSIKHLCYPHIYFNFNEETIDLDNEVQLLKKITDGKKMTPSEKKSASNGLSIAYSIIRCLNNKKKDFKIIAIPIGVSSSPDGQIDHSNILIIDLRKNKIMDMKDEMEKLKSIEIEKQDMHIRKASQKYLKRKNNEITAYLFEPNGEKYSKNNKIDSVVLSYINDANRILNSIKNLDLNISKFEVVGGEGLQTILGKKLRDGRQQTYGKSGYPICAGIGFWLIFKWMKRHFKETTLPFYINSLIKSLNDNPLKRHEDKENIKVFLKNIRNYAEDKYSEKMPEIIKKQTNLHIKNDPYLSNFLNMNNSTFKLSYIYTLTGNVNSKFSYRGMIDINFDKNKINVESRKI